MSDPGTASTRPTDAPTPRRSNAPFVVMAKPVGPICNLACDYCYYIAKADSYPRPHHFRMSDALLETYTRQYIEASPGPVVHFVWHGGEPTLAGLDFFRRAVELQRRYLPRGWTCWNNLQTNGTLLDDEWCRFLADERFQVGLSIDGVRTLHDLHRADAAGAPTFDRGRAALKALQAHGIQPDLLCTVTPEIAEHPKEVYRSLREMGTGWFQFLPIVNRGADGRAAPESVSSAAYGRFLKTVFDLWSQQDLGRLNVQFFAEMSLVWSGGGANLCWMAPTCGRVLVVEHDGAVYSCDHYVAADHRLGNFAEAHLGDLVDREAQQAFGAEKAALPGECRNCRWQSVCNGGCPKDRFSLDSSGRAGLNYLCEGLRDFFAHAEPALRQIIRRRRGGARPETVMAELRSTALERWRGVGRNDPCPCGSRRKAKTCCWSIRP